MRRKKQIAKTTDSALETAKQQAINSLEAVTNALSSRSILAGYANDSIGTTHNGTRDLYTILGYKKKLEFSDYLWRFKRQDIATRVVSAFPSAVWSMKPNVLESNTPSTETEFEVKFKQITTKNKLFYYLSRADIISGIGRYGIIVLGFNDSKKLDQPVTYKKNMQLTYMRPYHEGTAKILNYDTNPVSERYMKPDMYQVTPLSSDSTTLAQTSGVGNSFNVHHSRVIHVIPELATENDIFGTPRLENVYNRLQDIDTVSGGGAEMFWRGAFQGLAFKNDEGATMGEEARTALTNEIDNYVNNMQRYLKLQNMDVKTIETQVADPKNIFDVLCTLVSSAKAIPKRILLGSESGELASGQDEVNWNKRVDERRIDHGELLILRPFIDKMIKVGVLPEPATPYRIEWPDLYSMSAIDKSKIAESRMRALKDYLTMSGESVLPVKIFLEQIMGFSENIVSQIMEDRKDMSAAELRSIMESRQDNQDNNVL